ncbi:MAG: serine hydroxymethyltransferase [Candidatus Marinimicrobia bacterium]|nr:serine hydroxymethyltransferase [Candidatus Neomarinimicrobiota bacterium]
MKEDIKLFNAITEELNRERNTLEMIASENFTSRNVLDVVGSILTNKYAEGYPGKRYYGGCEAVDKVENIAKQRCEELFKADHANVQPHSGSQANMAVFLTFLNPGDTVIGLNLAHGGHLTHGSKVNFSGQFYNFISYNVDKETGLVNFEEIMKLAKKHKPKLIICGGSAYPRFIEFKEFRKIADEVNSYLMADIAHPSGLIAAGEHPSPWPYCDIVTSTTHKTLRGPRGGIILLGNDFKNRWGIVAPKSGRVKNMSELIDSSVMPGIQGGPLMHVIAGKAIAFKEALQPEFKEYCKQIISNAKTLALTMKELGYKLITDGTDTHLILIDLSDKKITGRLAESRLEDAGITTNKNMIPYDQKSPFVTSGIRIGTPALTSRGMKNQEMIFIANLIDKVLSNIENDKIIIDVKSDVKELCSSFKLYENLI